ncbi:MAG: toll/interleukin-1 receptor domain-containing protein, partial [Gammaproteobacteria bacterium]|nr:toll/interleukin-1 receptor domain-containing protein [Gammaproteobacteria bacterium]MBV9724541.1 toll/interleukin-1 receptor domain-containing protein [Gammaproteobacteria bacterium]
MTSRSVFVSYSQPDQATALGIVSHLEAHEVPCWVAPRDVQPGTEWAEQIVEAIAGACIMVLVFSASANGSPQVRREVERAVHRRVRILPFRVEPVLPAHSLEYFLSSQHWLDAFPAPMEPHYARLTAYVKSLLASRAGTAEVAGAGIAAARDFRPGPGLPDAGALLRLETELARFIGPVARHLVNRAAVRSAGVEELLALLGR